MARYLFADVVHEALSFSDDIPSEKLVLELIDSAWMQRLRDIYQTANSRLVYMFSEHSRFGHSLGVAFMANNLMRQLSNESKKFAEKIEPYRAAISCAALMHDIGHLAPGSHTAFKTWFPNSKDSHEEIGIKIINEDQEILEILNKYDKNLVEKISLILSESDKLPPWTWSIISGGGWNVDRGNWCIVDSQMAGVSYGKYNITALVESITITDDDKLALKENRLDAMMHFSVSRHAMYRQVYQHRVMLAADSLTRAIVLRARDLGEKLEFADDTMRVALVAKEPTDLNLETIFWMRESWWRYHLSMWSLSKDKILSDLAMRLINRRLFKTIRVAEDNLEEQKSKIIEILKQQNLDPRYYLDIVSTADIHGKETKPMMVLKENGKVAKLSDSDPLFDALGKTDKKMWFVVPAEVKTTWSAELHVLSTVEGPLGCSNHYKI